jgi:hypothetical protein
MKYLPAALPLLLVFTNTRERGPTHCFAGRDVGYLNAGVASPACSCVFVGNSVGEARALFSAVFVGRVDSVERVTSTSGSGDRTPLVRARLRVLAAWPGAVPDSLSAGRRPETAITGRGPAPVLADSVVWVTTPDSGPSCGFHFKRGAEYLVYADGPHTDLWTTKCSRTRRLGRARADLERLGQPSIDRRNGYRPPS